MIHPKDLTMYRKQYHGKTIVVKFGGALCDDEVVRNIADQIKFMTMAIGTKVVVVHGGGRQIDEALTSADIRIVKDNAGIRVTDLRTLEISDDALRVLNGRIVRIFNSVSSYQGCVAIGLAGYDGQVLNGARAYDPLNFTGHMSKVNVPLLEHLASAVIPVIYPVCANGSLLASDTEDRLNINADDVACAIASALSAERLIFCTNTGGVLDEGGKIISDVDVAEAYRMASDGTVSGGMITKLLLAARAAEMLHSDNGGVAIISGTQEGAILEELLTQDGAGTLIRSAARGLKL